MKPNLLCKQIDLIGQAIMLLPLISLLLPDQNQIAFYTYFTIGAWQCFSCLMNFITHGPGSVSRQAYSWILLVIIASFGLAVAIAYAFHSNSGMDWLVSYMARYAYYEAFIMLFAGPVLAIWYGLITVTEYLQVRNEVQHRREIHWKC